MHKLYFFLFAILLPLASCINRDKPNKQTIDDVAEEYVKLCLRIGQYDESFVDAYYGPQKWQPAEKTSGIFPYEELKWKANDLLHKIDRIDPQTCKKELKLRRNFLIKQLEAVATRLDIMSGKQLPFDLEAKKLYDIAPPQTALSAFDVLIDSISLLVPGEGPLNERYLEYSKQFIIPPDKLSKVFNTAIAEARKRVSEKIELPKDERFELSYVTNQPWSGYNWYQGNYHSLIQINTDLPIYIERAIDLACHEGYPGHHVFNAMLEKSLVKDKGWVEFMVYPLFSPQSFIAEGSANFGIEMAFPGLERLEYEKSTLFPLAGIDSGLADTYYEIQALRKKLLFAEISIARGYLQGSIDPEEAENDLMKYLLFSRDRAKQRLSFYTTYRSYVINYSLGEKMIENFVNEFGASKKERWQAFYQLLSTPRTASVL